jgi:putative inorganic carbon (HCO3(-)) transporter
VLQTSILGKVYNIWLESGIFSILQTIYRAFSRSFTNSTIVHFFVRDSHVERSYADSLFALIFKAVLNFIVEIIHRISMAIARAAHGGFFAEFARRYLRTSFFINYETFLGGFLCLMFIIPHSYWSNSYALIAAVGLFVLLIIMMGVGTRQKFHLYEMGFPLTVFAIVCVFSLAFSYDKSDSLRVLLFYFTAFLFVYIITADITSKERLMKLCGFIYLAVIITSLYAIYQRFVGVAVSESLTDLATNKGVPGRVYSTLDNPNNYAEFLVIMTPLAAMFAVNVNKIRLRVPLCMGIVFPAVALLMTYSRSGWISVVIACVVFVYYANKKLIPAFFLLCVIAFPFLPDSVMVRIASLFNPEDTSNLYRTYIWEGALRIVRDYWYTGIGLGPESFAYVYPDYANPLAEVGAPHSHMVYLELIVELGVLGFITFMWYMLRLWIDTTRSLLRCPDRKVQLFQIACIASLVGIAFTFWVEYVWYYPRTFFAYFILAGISCAAIRISQQETLRVSAPSESEVDNEE